MATASSPVSPSRVASSASKLHLPASTDPPSESNPPTQKVWLVFGATGHIGRSIVKTALAHGDNVAAVGRTLENSMAEMQDWHERCLGLLCDVRVCETVASAIERSIEHFGRVDIIVNCTGYGVIGACEDQDMCDLRSQFETNFLGTLNILQLSLPYFREQSAKRKDETENAGRYLIFSSTSGALGVPGLGPYCATKYAVEGLIESMLYEIDAFGIKATLVAPGHMRLDGPSRRSSSLMEDRPVSDVKMDGGFTQPAHSEPDTRLKRFGHFFVKQASPPYADPTSPSGHASRVIQWLQDKQPTSAAKSAELVWQLGHCRYPPLRLLLGGFAIESVRDRLRSIIEEIEDWKHLSFPGAEEEEEEEEGGKVGRQRKGSDARDDEANGEGEGGDEGEEQEDANDAMDVELEAILNGEDDEDEA